MKLENTIIEPKSQNVRILDVLLIGPLMIWGGYKLHREAPILGPLLLLFGASTIVYNAINYNKLAKAGL